MSTYYIVRDELSHHGVRGMKWGVRKERKYEQKAQRWGALEGKLRTRAGKNFAGTMRIAYKSSAEQQKAINNSKSAKERWRNRLGAEATARTNRMNADIYAMKSARARTKIGRNVNANRAFNANSMARNYENVAASSKSTFKRAKYSAKNTFKTPMKTVYRGKNTTYGKEVAKAMVLNVAINAAQQALKD